jgi:hypothetical protein
MRAAGGVATGQLEGRQEGQQEDGWRGCRVTK